MTQPDKIRWDEALSTGDDNLDSQHKVLLGIFNDLANIIETGANRDNIEKILLALKHYARWHFTCEEDCMEKYHCPVADVNKKGHAFFVQRLESYEQDFYHAKDITEFALHVHNDLARWIYVHILEVDAKLYHSIHATPVPKDIGKE